MYIEGVSIILHPCTPDTNYLVERCEQNEAVVIQCRHGHHTTIGHVLETGDLQTVRFQYVQIQLARIVWQIAIVESLQASCSHINVPRPIFVCLFYLIAN